METAEASGDRTKTWDVINKAFGKTKKKRTHPESTTIDINGTPQKTTCPKDIANSMNSHFAGVAEKLAKKLKHTNVNPLKYMGQKKQSKYFSTQLFASRGFR